MAAGDRLAGQKMEVHWILVSMVGTEREHVEGPKGCRRKNSPLEGK